MVGRLLSFVLVLCVKESLCQQAKVTTYENVNHAHIFNRSLVWLTTASELELDKIVSSPGFCRFSVTVGKNLLTEYDLETSVNLSTQTLNRINTIVAKNLLALNRLKSVCPDVEYFQWSDYLERIEKYDKGPVFVFRDNQLTHIWIDFN